MFFTPQRLPVSWLSFCIALAGAAYCAIHVAPVPVSVPCPGNGCALFQDFTVLGVSLWWVGAAYFAVMALLCLRRANSLAHMAATAALVADAALLIIMLGTASCVSCLGAGLLIALLFLSLRRHIYAKAVPAPGPSVALFLWGGLFIAALAFAATENLGPWQIAGQENTERRIYFAPSCPACRDAIAVFANDAAFVPVAEKSSDHAAIYGMERAIRNGATIAEALDAVMRAQMNGALAEPSFPDSLILQVKLARNKAEVLRLGFSQLPLIMINGMPQTLRPGNAATPPAAPAGRDRDSSALPPELLAPVDACGDGAPVPCDPPL